MFTTDPSGPSSKRSAALTTLLPLAGIHSPLMPSSNKDVPSLSRIAGAFSKSSVSLLVAYLLATLPIPYERAPPINAPAPVAIAA